MRDLRTVGIISDTHGLLRPEAVEALIGVDIILHAGDVGSKEVLCGLQGIAPVKAVRGNVDKGDWAQQLPFTSTLDLEGMRFFLIHKISDLPAYPVPADTHFVVYGHSHKPSQFERDGVCYLNPGSAGRQRFSLPISLVIGRLEAGIWSFSFRTLAESR